MLNLSAACDKGEGFRYVHWKIFYSRWTVLLQLEWRRYSEHYVEDTSQQVGSGIAA